MPDPSGPGPESSPRGLGFGTYMAGDLALVADVLPDQDNIAKDLGVFTSPARSPSPSHRRSRQPSCSSVVATTACCTPRRESARSYEPFAILPVRGVP